MRRSAALTSLSEARARIAETRTRESSSSVAASSRRLNASLSSAAPRARAAFARATASSSESSIARSASLAFFARIRESVFAASARIRASRLVRNLAVTTFASSGRARNAAVKPINITSRLCFAPFRSSASRVSRIASPSSLDFPSFAFAAAIFPAASTARTRTGTAVLESARVFKIASTAFVDSISPRANAAISRTFIEPLLSSGVRSGIAFSSPIRPTAKSERI